MAAAHPAEGVAIDPALHLRVAQFLGLEALLLDQGRFEEWYDLLDEALTYRVPLRFAAETRADEVVPGALLIDDTRAMIRIRLDRFATGLAHAEAPPSRTIRSVGSLHLANATAERVEVASTLILYRVRGNDPRPEIFHARRADVLHIAGDDPVRLVARTVTLAESSMSAANLAVFL